MTARKQIAWALINQLNGQGPQTSPVSLPQNPVFPTVGRKIVDPETLSGGDYPALFLIKPGEQYTYDGEGDTVPPTRTMEFLAVIYTKFDQTNDVPADGIDDLLDGIDAAIAAGATDQIANQGRQTLGNLVYNCVITGEPHKMAPGDMVSGRGEVFIPIRVTLNSYP